MNSSIEKLRQDLEAGIISLMFTKVNGELREVIATMSKDYVPEPKAPKNPNMARPVPSDNVLFWDLDALAFKSCKFDNVIAWKVEEV
jgi:hypothetical protein